MDRRIQTGIDKLKQAFAENPIAVIGVAALAATAGSKLMDANTRRKSAKTWAREVDRRTVSGKGRYPYSR